MAVDEMGGRGGDVVLVWCVFGSILFIFSSLA